MYSKPTVYLAGGMEKAGEFGRVWRENITPHLKSLGYDVWDPYHEELDVGINVEQLAKLKKTDYNKFLLFCQKIVDYDINHLKRCAAVLVRIDESVLTGAGTFGELTFCRIWKIPVHAWIDLPNNELDVPSWAMGCVTTFTTCKKEFYNSLPDINK